MADSDRKPEKIDLAEILGAEAGQDTGEVVVLDPGTGKPARAGSSAAEGETGSEALRAAEAEKEKYFDLWVRVRADFENFRKRIERERGEESARAGAVLVRDLLPVADNLERALAGLGEDDPVRQGIALIHRQLMECLARAGLEPIDALGRVFDPVYHEAVVSEPTDRFEPNRVLEEMQRGYTFRGRVLRPSLVKVSVAAPGAAARGDDSGADRPRADGAGPAGDGEADGSAEQ